MDVMNPNGFGVPLSGVDWQLAIGGARAATGTVQLSQTIPAKGIAPVTTTLTVDARDAITVASALAGGARDYQITAQLHFATQVGQLDVNIKQGGTIDRGSLFGLR
jgi:LEA14-like dessication related protein